MCQSWWRLWCPLQGEWSRKVRTSGRLVANSGKCNIPSSTRYLRRQVFPVPTMHWAVIMSCYIGSVAFHTMMSALGPVCMCACIVRIQSQVQQVLLGGGKRLCECNKWRKNSSYNVSASIKYNDGHFTGFQCEPPPPPPVEYKSFWSLIYITISIVGFDAQTHFL